MIALYQSHAYSEYLPNIIGSQKMQEFDLYQSGRKSKNYIWKIKLVEQFI